MTASPAVRLSSDISSRFLEGLAANDRTSILQTATLVRFRPKTLITTQGDSAHHVYLLTKGCARYFFLTQAGRKILLRWFLPGELFGACALLPTPFSYLVSTETIKDSIALVWDRVTIRTLATRLPRLWENALAIASEYLTLYVSAHVALTSRTAHERAAEILLNLAATIGSAVTDGFELEISDEELANAACISLFTASRFIAQWQRSGAIAKNRGKVLVISPERLLSPTLV